MGVFVVGCWDGRCRPSIDKFCPSAAKGTRLPGCLKQAYLVKI